MDDITITVEEMKLIESALMDKIHDLTMKGYTAHAQQHREVRDKLLMIIALGESAREGTVVTA